MAKYLKQRPPHLRYVDFALPIDREEFRYTEPVSFVILERVQGDVIVGKEQKVGKWAHLYRMILKQLYQKDPRIMEAIADRSYGSTEKGEVVRARDKNKLGQAIFITEDLAVEGQLEATAIVRKIKRFLKLYGVDLDLVRIAYRKIQQPPEHPKPHKDNTDELSSFVKPSAKDGAYDQAISWLTGVIAARFPRGFDPHSAIDRSKLKKAAEESGLPLLQDGGDLDRTIGSLDASPEVFHVEEKLVVVRRGAQKEVARLLDEAFDTGCQIVFYKPFIEKHKSSLAGQGVFCEQVLRELLKRAGCQGKCVLKKHFASCAPSGGRQEDEIIKGEIRRVAGGENMVELDALCTSLEYIPRVKVENTLKLSKQFAGLGGGKYFDVARLDVTDEEAEQIRRQVGEECEQKGCALMANLPLESVADRNWQLAERGTGALRRAVWKAVLSDEYDFGTGEVLHKKSSGGEEGLKAQLQSYCLERGKVAGFCTTGELNQKAQSMIGRRCQWVVLDVLYQSMVRVSKEAFVPSDQITFARSDSEGLRQIDEIDQLLSEAIASQRQHFPSGFIPTQAIASFALFPACGTAWNSFVLESYVLRFSKRFKLCHTYLNSSNLSAIAPKELDMDFDQMQAEALATSGVPLTQESAGRWLKEAGFVDNVKSSAVQKAITMAEQLKKRM